MKFLTNKTLLYSFAFMIFAIVFYTTGQNFVEFYKAHLNEFDNQLLNQEQIKFTNIFTMISIFSNIHYLFSIYKMIMIFFFDKKQEQNLHSALLILNSYLLLLSFDMLISKFN